MELNSPQKDAAFTRLELTDMFKEIIVHMDKRFDKVESRLDSIEGKLDKHDHRIEKLEDSNRVIKTKLGIA